MLQPFVSMHPQGSLVEDIVAPILYLVPERCRHSREKHSRLWRRCCGCNPAMICRSMRCESKQRKRLRNHIIGTWQKPRLFGLHARIRLSSRVEPISIASVGEENFERALACHRRCWSHDIYFGISSHKLTISLSIIWAQPSILSPDEQSFPIVYIIYYLTHPQDACRHQSQSHKLEEKD